MTAPNILQNDQRQSSSHAQKALRRGRDECSLNEFTSWCTGKKNIFVNQAIAKCTAHLPSFEIGQMCSMICRLLIFKRLKKRVHPEVNSLKWLSGARSDGERLLLLRKEWGNAGETRLLRKECSMQNPLTVCKSPLRPSTSSSPFTRLPDSAGLSQLTCPTQIACLACQAPQTPYESVSATYYTSD